MSIDFYCFTYHIILGYYYISVGGNAMSKKCFTKYILHQLGIGKSYSGYDYILYGIDLILHEEDLLHCVTKVLYIDIAKKYNTNSSCVERNIRKAIEVIWKDTQDKNGLIEQVFGRRHLSSKPSNKEFLELLCEYVKQPHCSDNITCPISNTACSVYQELMENLIKP